MEYDVRNDCYVNIVNLPARVKGLCTVIGDDTIVLINECLSDDARAEALDHELRHIRRGDLFKNDNAKDIEDELQEM